LVRVVVINPNILLIGGLGRSLTAYILFMREASTTIEYKAKI
jgi:hypothetical protein